MKKYTNNDFLGLMGQSEMECAVAVIANKANNLHIQFKDVTFTSHSDFKDDGFERDGFYALLDNAWIENIGSHIWKPSKALVERVTPRLT